MKIGFVGLTHLGLNYLAATAQKNFNVAGFDIDANKVENYKKFNFEHKEPFLKQTIYKNKNKISFYSNLKKLKNFDLIFISLDTTTNAKGKSDEKPLLKLIKKVIPNIKKNSNLIILSQVRPGFMRKIKFNKDRLYYQVETLIFGQAIKRALKPERIIIGLKEKSSKISKNYNKFLKAFYCPIIKMNYESAELTKISINVFLASSVTTSNVLARMCETISADWSQISKALKLDRRIGQFAYLKPGLGISGGNLERDLFTIKTFMNKDRYGSNLINNFEDNSKYMKNWVVRKMKKKLTKNKIVGIFGLTYKDGTNSTKNSPSIDLIKKIKKNKTFVYDPNVNIKNLNKNLRQVDNFKTLIINSNILIFMTDWKNIDIIKKYMRRKNLRNTIVIDPYRLVDFKKNEFKEYITLGK